MDKWLIWCNLNAEQDALAKSFGNLCVSIQGSDTSEQKEERERLWREGDVPILITKPSCLGWGMNWQHCHNVAFVGLSDSFESYYQAIRRCWRFGQKKPVNVYVITAETEGAVVANIKRKEHDAMKMAENMVEHMKDLNAEAVRAGGARTKDRYAPSQEIVIPDWVEAA